MLKVAFNRPHMLEVVCACDYVKNLTPFKVAYHLPNYWIGNTIQNV